MTATLPDAAAKKKQEPAAEQQVAAELVRLAKEQGLSLTGPDGLLKQLTKTVIDTALQEEMTEHLGYEKYDPAGAGTGNIGNGTRSRMVLTEHSGHVEIGRHSVTNCANGRSVELITITSAGQEWPGSKPNTAIERALGPDRPCTAVNATDTLWSFFTAHPKT